MQMPQIIANRFEIADLQADLLGQGAMGQVFRGHDRLTGERVAIKVIKSELIAVEPDIVARFHREGEALRQLNHPNIVKMLAAATEVDAETGKETHYLAMEYVSGGSLRDLLDGEKRLPVQRVLQIGVELADALSRAHHLDIIHRDIKPDNVLLAEDGTPRLTDFGIAHMADLPQLTQTGVIVGTVHYLSPEACNGSKLTPQADIWAFGVMLYEMLAGVIPFSGENILAVITAILTMPLPNLLDYCPEAPAELVELIGRMTAKEPKDRIPSARFVAAQLEAIQKHWNLQQAPPAPTSKARESPALAAPPQSPVEHPVDLSSTMRRNQRILLDKVKNFWIDGVLEKTATDASLLEIVKCSANHAVERPWEGVIGEMSDSDEAGHLKLETTEIFYRADRSLLILGAPGAGKTIALLKLARSLIERAEMDPSQPIPVVLNLASWSEKRTPVAEWVTNELTAKYQIPRKMGRIWLDDNMLTLLLDDLDEIPARYLPDAVRAINTFRESHGLTGIIIASRTEAYESAGVRLKFGGAVELQPLTPTQIDSYLGMSGPQMYELRATIRGDAALTKIAQSPLWLNVMSIAYSDEDRLPGDSYPSKPGLMDSAIYRQRLIHSYIRYAYRRRSVGAKYLPEEINRILTWLAQKMDAFNQGIFLLEGIQPGWLPPGVWRWVYSLGKGLILGIINATTVWLGILAFSAYAPFDETFLNHLSWIFLLGFPIGVVLGGIQGLMYENVERQGKPAVSTARQRWMRSIIFGVVSAALFLAGLVLLDVEIGTAVFVSIWSGAFYTVSTQNDGTTYRNAIETVEALSWSWKEALRSLIPGVIIGLIFTLVTAYDDLDMLLYAWTLWTCPWALVFFLTGGLKGRQVEKTSRPNQGIWLSARNAVFLGGLIGSVLGVFFWLFQELYGVGTHFAVFMGLMTLFSLAMTNGANIIGHYFIRLLLYFSDRIPLDLTDFLEHAAGLILLRKVGGGYIYIHRMLMQYFTSLESM